MGTDYFTGSFKFKKEPKNTHDKYAEILYRAMPTLLSYWIPALLVAYPNI